MTFSRHPKQAAKHDDSLDCEFLPSCRKPAILYSLPMAGGLTCEVAACAEHARHFGIDSERPSRMMTPVTIVDHGGHGELAILGRAVYQEPSLPVWLPR